MQERAIFGFGRIGERVFPLRRDRAAEVDAIKKLLSVYSLEAIDAFGVADVYQVKEKIAEFHPKPGHRWNRKTRSTPEVWQALLELQFAGVLNCDTVPEIDPRTGRETGKARFLWSRKPAETPTART